MLEFLKKKKKDGNPTESPEEKSDKKDKGKKDSAGAQDTPSTVEEKPEKKKKKWLSKKLIIMIVLFLIALGAAAIAVYILHFAPKSPETLKASYHKMELKHINLPEEMVRFCFENFPDLYAAIIACNTEIILIDKEIARIDEIAKKYPDQGKIAEKEKAVWEKAKINLQKGFLKIEKPVKEIYVLFNVNKEQAMIQINEKNKELTELAGAALAPARELTQKLITEEEAPPQGLINGTLYKLKKKFL
ncbi:MAG: hypothetical protein WC836_02005 [Desulfobacula sp.]